MYRVKLQPLMWWYLEMGPWEVIGMFKHPKGGVPLQWDSAIIRRTIVRAWCLCIKRRQQHSHLPVKERFPPRSWSFGFKLASFLQKCKKINFCCLKIPSHDNFYGSQSQLIEKGFSTFPNHLIISLRFKKHSSMAKIAWKTKVKSSPVSQDYFEDYTK